MIKFKFRGCSDIDINSSTMFEFFSRHGSHKHIWTVPHFVLKMYKFAPSIVLLPFSIHSWGNCSQALSQSKKSTCSFL